MLPVTNAWPESRASAVKRIKKLIEKYHENGSAKCSFNDFDEWSNK